MTTLVSDAAACEQSTSTMRSLRHNRSPYTVAAWPSISGLHPTNPCGEPSDSSTTLVCKLVCIMLISYTLASTARARSPAARLTALCWPGRYMAAPGLHAPHLPSKWLPHAIGSHPSPRNCTLRNHTSCALHRHALGSRSLRAESSRPTWPHIFALLWQRFPHENCP